MVIRENENVMVELGDRVKVENPVELQLKLNQLGQRIADKIPAGYTVKIVRDGQFSFLLGILSQRNIVEQQFGIQWNPVTKFVTWAGVL
ncbi:hypothetical protein [Cronobacter phage Dev_CS701]|jgi:hypothetical protein|uniref:Uncharacterized protein n=4 Tax=Pseudotevenvirus leb TaxID=2844035 RepID=A0A7T3TLL4_9CAUD|nr:hypothetical protein HWB00_gp074 [Cronobacter phage vB_CsaM_leB]AOG16480.1 hypothetical protein N_074 [Cronobacter phage vB_CsaM_leN]QJI53121.1 hypothetical protein EBPL_00078 [Enterobacter phage EBPL]QPX76423.1 hypothetical protein [Cronobacter phage vB_CsaM_SemperBestia]UGV22893.1 hypothetical protein INVICTA_123 [Cronobacter phage vB_CsaM_Invicta]UPW35494.1 hypothetical protein [Cronobacter phage Dev_CS701]URP85824.1 hypothetical protein ECW2_0146 [Enterobacter phage EC-W2]